MNRSTYRMLQGLVTVAAVFLLSLAVRGVAVAQEADAYNLYVATPANGSAGEFPLPYVVHLSDGTQRSGTITAAGLQTLTVPSGVDVTSVNVNGQVVNAGGPQVFFPFAGGCWRWCIKCHIWFWPPRVRCWIIGYWDPCC
ncbi:MAG TPA: hypothetical protein VHI13_06940 [Candidatus Kapabacteria bacterium]|nr:hypothetical protein [Candidatus Kapabacteria bacterium]